MAGVWGEEKMQGGRFLLAGGKETLTLVVHVCCLLQAQLLHFKDSSHVPYSRGWHLHIFL